MTVQLAGHDSRVLSLRDLEASDTSAGLITIELPLRRAGFLLPPWSELQSIRAWCRENRIPLHLDGARLWESASYYARSYDEISALFDSVYVSLYKSLGGIGGAILAGSASFITAARVWRARQVGVLPNNSFLAISALAGIERHLPRMAEYCERARRLAAALRSQLALRTLPEVPQTNGFHLDLPLEINRLNEARLRIARTRSVWLFNKLLPSSTAGHTIVELWLGEASDEVPLTEIVELVGEVLAPG
jgi:threonine aldolase